MFTGEKCCVSTFRVTPLFMREDSRLPETGSHHQRKQVRPLTQQAVLDSDGQPTDWTVVDSLQTGQWWTADRLDSGLDSGGQLADWTQECNLHVCGEGWINVGHFTSCVI